jgi:hypothetical protein
MALAAILFALPFPVMPAIADDECAGGFGCSHVETDPSSSAIVGHGAMILPTSFAPIGMSRSSASTCVDCEWALAPLCVAGPDPGTICAGATVGCAPEELRMRILVRRGGGSWENAGVMCVGEGSRPVPVADFSDEVRDRFVDRLPQPRPSFQPDSGGLTNLPVVFASGQRAGVRTDDFDLLGYPVTVRARPSWEWTWGDGSPRLRTDDAGGRWPDVDVSHRFTAPGRYAVSVEASWAGTFTVDGLGPFDVEGGPVTQAADLDVLVRDAPAELVGD